MKIGLESISVRRSWTNSGAPSRNARIASSAPGWQVLRHPAGPDVGVVHPQAGDQLQQVQGAFPQPRALGVDRGRAQFQAHRGDPAQVRGDPVELEHQDPDDLGPLGNLVLDSEQPLHREAVRHLVEQRHQVVRTGAERDPLGPGAVLHVLLDAGVQVADGRPDLGDGLALEGQDQAEHAVGGRVLRSHVDDQPLAGLEVPGLVGGGDDLVPVLAGDGVDLALRGFGVGRPGGRVRCLRHE